MPVHFPSHSQAHKIDGVWRAREAASEDLMGKQQTGICLLMESIFSKSVNRAAATQNYTVCEKHTA